MYTSVKNAQIVLALLKEHNIKHIVINPGTTNVPIVQGVQNDPFFKCYSVVDERSAMYFAIGLYLETGEKVATTCTSAQATRNYIPGLTEAFYKHVPILAITVSKHPKFDYQGYPQHPIQTSIPEDAVKKTYALPYISNRLDELQTVRMVNEAILELTHREPGPIQLNLPMLDEELASFSEIELPKVRVIKRYMYYDEIEIDLFRKKIMIVVGEHRPFTTNEIITINNFAASYDVFIYVNHLSNYHGDFSIPANIVLLSMSNETFQKSFCPDILITIGGQTGDYSLLRKLTFCNEFDFEHWHVSNDGQVVDIYDNLTKVFEIPFTHFFERFTKKGKSTHEYFKLWEEAFKSIHIATELPMSNAYLAQQLHSSIPKNSYLNFAILNSLRNWSLFSLDKTIKCYSNVAAFGIDGCMSMFLGQSVQSDELCFLVIGDLAFFYDMNSLGIKHLKNNIRILLVNNGCGIEFRMNSSLHSQMKSDIYPNIAAKGHFQNARGWAKTCGFKYLEAKTKEEFILKKEEFVNKSNQSMIFEVYTDPEDEVLAFKRITSSNHIESKVKSMARSVLGGKGIGLLKNIVKK